MVKLGPFGNRARDPPEPDRSIASSDDGESVMRHGEWWSRRWERFVVHVCFCNSRLQLLECAGKVQCCNELKSALG